MMDPDIKAKWVDALRSGKYQQASSALRTFDDEFCCLGVLCDLVNPGRWEYKDMSLRQYRFAQMWSFPPTDLLENVGLSGVQADKLAQMNDAGDTFARIAEYIEKTL